MSTRPPFSLEELRTIMGYLSRDHVKNETEVKVPARLLAMLAVGCARKGIDEYDLMPPVIKLALSKMLQDCIRTLYPEAGALADSFVNAEPPTNAVN